jgi:hypothetical protein
MAPFVHSFTSHPNECECDHWDTTEKTVIEWEDRSKTLVCTYFRDNLEARFRAPLNQWQDLFQDGPWSDDCLAALVPELLPWLVKQDALNRFLAQPYGGSYVK